MTAIPNPTEFLEAVRKVPEHYDRILEAFLTGRGNPLGDIDQVLAEDPQSVFGHCLRIAIVVRGDDTASRSKLLESITAIEAMCPERDHRARRHAFAARAWLAGDQSLAVERYGDIVLTFPRDIVALVVAHALDFRLGLRRMLRQRVAHVLPYWQAYERGYASVLAIYAFGLEENGQYRRAERMARRALEIEPWHPGAVHVIAHVMEMQGRFQEGLAFLAATEPGWRDTSFSVHLAWHRALFHLAADDTQSALAVYDAQIAEPRFMSELADASALLWRLQLRGCATANRWPRLADSWETQELAGARNFYIAHAMMAFAAAGRTAATQRIFDLLRPADTNGALARHSDDALIVPLCRGLLAFARGDYASCVEWLRGVRRIAYQCGGSLAQCNVIRLTLVEALKRLDKAPLTRSLRGGARQAYRLPHMIGHLANV